MAKLVKLQTQQNMLYTPPSSDYVLVTTGLDSQGNVTQLVKKSDGTFVSIGGGSSAVLGMVDAQGKFQALSFQGTTASNSGDPETVTSYYSWNGTLPVPGPETGGSSDGYVVVEEDGVLKAQKLSFNGAEASFDGTAETLDATKVGLFATTQDEPAYKGVPMGGGAFYKCTSVDTTAKTWSGYLAVLGEDGTYSFEETVTTGLAYGNGFTPAVGNIYNADATVRVDKLFEGASAVPDAGLVFYMPFNGNAEPVEGSVTSMTGELTYGEVNGIGYAVFDGSTYLNVALADSADSDSTVALTFMVPETPPNSPNYMLRFNAGGADRYPCVYVNDIGSVGVGIASGNKATSISWGTWYSVVATYTASDKVATYYLNKVVVGSGSTDQYGDQPPIGSSELRLGNNNGGNMYEGYLADVAVWNRVLTEEEIALLAARAASMN